MSLTRSTPIDPRAWLLWWLAASLPPLVSRNPFLLIVTLLVVVIVRFGVGTTGTSGPGTTGVIKLATFFMSIGVLFNLLTVHAGDDVLATIPDSVPLIGGDITLNAAVYGVLGGIAVLILVVTGLTVAANLEWPALLRLMPDAFVGLGVAGSIAFTFFPQTIASFREIREARLIRGAPVRSPGDYASLAAPMLASGLDRAVTLSELLEIRGLGSTAGTHPRPMVRSLAIAAGLASLCIAAYLFAIGRLAGTGAALAVVAVATLVIVRSAPEPFARRTRYRLPEWTLRDSVVAGGAIVAAGGVLATLGLDPGSIRYEPYPSLDLPLVSLPAIVALTGLLGPVAIQEPS